MSRKKLDEIKNEYGPISKGWEIFHENSKLGRFDVFAPVEWILGGMQKYAESLHYEYCRRVDLPSEHIELEMKLSQAIESRESVREYSEQKISLAELDALLYYSYGINRSNEGTEYPRPFRNVPSGGGLYPLDIYFYTSLVEGLEPGVWHYNPLEEAVFLVHPGNKQSEIAGLLAQQELVNAPLLVFVCAHFERSLFKYRDRGYRFIYLDAGHLVQNFNLVANSMGIGSVNIGGYFDRDTDHFLEIDGLTQSTVYMIAVGKKKTD